MSTGQKPSAKPITLGWEHVIYTAFGALGCYLGVWVGPSLHKWEHSAPDLYAAFAGMGIGYILAAILNGMIAGMRGK